MNYDKYLNPVAVDIKPSGIRKFFDIVAERPDAISLGGISTAFLLKYFL